MDGRGGEGVSEGEERKIHRVAQSSRYAVKEKTLGGEVKQRKPVGKKKKKKKGGGKSSTKKVKNRCGATRSTGNR